MFRIKRLYTFILQTFLPIFAMVFGICLFIVLLQFLWRYIEDLVGKGIDGLVLGEMFFYAALTLVPMALPLAILLASLMTFGNLGERLELLAMKAAGVSLLRIMRPLIIVVAFISVGAFFFQNNVMPVSQVKLYTLLLSIRQKSPEVEIPVRAFYNEIPGYNVYVRGKDPESGLLKDVMIYDYSGSFDNASVIVADSGKLSTTADKRMLVLDLYDGESFKNFKSQQPTKTKASPYQRETFKTKEILIEFDANFSRMDDSFMAGQNIGKNLGELQHSLDSMNVRLDSIRDINAQSIIASTLSQYKNSKDTSSIAKPVAAVIDFDSIYTAQNKPQRKDLINRSRSLADANKADYYFKANVIADESQRIRRHLTEWHRKFTLSFACLVFFFIGAPLGAIIRKGGLGTPVVLSVILYIFYYIIDNIGFKMARDGVWIAWGGMWLSSFVLFSLGIFLTYKAVNDSTLLSIDAYAGFFKKIFGKRTTRNITKKEIVMEHPNYHSLLTQCEVLKDDITNYIKTNTTYFNYFGFWKNGRKDRQLIHISKEMEHMINKLSNSDNSLIIAKLMDFPSPRLFSHTSPLAGKISIVIGFIFPLAIPYFLYAMYQKKLLISDLKISLKTDEELQDLLEKEIEEQGA